VFVATDGDTALDALHKRTQSRYFTPAPGGGIPTLREAAHRIAKSSEYVLGDFKGWTCVAVSDFLHLVTAIRYRLCCSLIRRSKSGDPPSGL
jgi:hypothetical protein